MTVDQLKILCALTLLTAYALLYWSWQPTCGPDEVRVRGMFITACVKGH